ncbi:uncharacterized protein LOC142175247 [Nicotiana tabacum]|uniref:Uncharacterized protein LOC142175247 n=1 Tax=Nicotiana tabacum TaxID=4097 RepID=A0AC58TL50_TOBAC
MIILSILTNTKEEKLLRVLRKHKKAIGWIIADIKGIGPSFCMHKIFLEYGHRLSVEHQRRLNPIMKEVVKKKVIKLLNAGIILPISDSNWDTNQIVICPKDQEKTTFTCPYDTFTFKRMSFGLYVTFNFDDARLKAFEELKKKLVAAPIIVAPDWSLPFELMCDASDHAVGAVIGQRKDKEFDVEIRDRKGTENQVADHLSRLENHNHVEEGGQIKEVFPDEQLFATTQDPPPWYADYVNYLMSGVLPLEIESEARKRFLHDVNFYYWDGPYLYKQCAD